MSEVNSTNSSLSLIHTNFEQHRDPYPLWFDILLSHFTVACSIVTVTGNIYVLVAFFTGKALRSYVTNYFIASLAVTDILLGLLSMNIYTIYLIVGDWLLGEAVCQLWLTLDHTLCLTSQYTVFCITLDRFLSVKLMTTYRRWRTDRLIKRCIVLTWLLPALLFIALINYPYIWHAGSNISTTSSSSIMATTSTDNNNTSIIITTNAAATTTTTTTTCYAAFTLNVTVNTVFTIVYYWITLTVMITLYFAVYSVARQLEARAKEKRKKYLNVLHSNNNNNNNNNNNTSTTTNHSTARPSIDQSTDYHPQWIAKKQQQQQQQQQQSNDENVSMVSHLLSFLRSKLQCFVYVLRAPASGSQQRQRPRGSSSVTLFSCNAPCGVQRPQHPSESSDRLSFESSSRTPTTPSLLTVGPRCGGTTGEGDGAGKEGPFDPQKGLRRGTIAIGVVDDARKFSHAEPAPRSQSLSTTASRSLDERRKSGTPSLAAHGLSQSLVSDQRRNNRANKALRTISIILGTFVVCWTPYHVLVLLHPFITINSNLYAASYWLCYMNSLFNPFCYAFANEQFKRKILSLLKCQASDGIRLC